MAIIASILGILVFIVVEILPLAWPAKVEPRSRLALPDLHDVALAVDEYVSHVQVLGAGEDGSARARSYHLSDGSLIDEVRPFGSERVIATAVAGREGLSAVTADGALWCLPVRFDVEFHGEDRAILPRRGKPIRMDIGSGGLPVEAYAAQLGGDGHVAAAIRLAGGKLVLLRREVETSPISGEEHDSVERSEVACPADATAMTFDGEGRCLYLGTRGGDLLRWTLPSREPERLSTGGTPVTALTLLIGDHALVVGTGDGSLSVWFAVRGPDRVHRLTRIRDLPRRGGSITALAASRRDRSFLAADAGGGLSLLHSTSDRLLWEGESPMRSTASLVYAPKGDAALAIGARAAELVDIRNPHPEVSFPALFGKVWYEGYEKPEYVWQSTGGTDDFEPKLSLTPLLVGTLKGTIYSLLLAIPLAVLGAMYTSQFLHPSLKRYVKPVVEIMAALPSVVLGFLAGLWLAPRVADAFPALILMVVLLPALVLAGGFAYKSLPVAIRGRLPNGMEAIFFLFVLAAGMWLSFRLSGRFERVAFDGSFTDWLLSTTGLRYDQRNAVIVGLAMGFAVVPIIFAISEDAFSNVPRSLVSGSLALGANQWQTVTRVVLPTASPGIFSAIMVGFGRAVGETMIVLMATGNTPILDMNPFNGFRTLSANIAVEIPEAPHGGTLYRTLFLAGLLLFAVTFAVNTAAELVRQRLRRKFAGL